MIPDIGGLRPLFDDLVAKLATENGWAVAAVEPFPGREQMTLEERMDAMAALDDDRQLADIVAAADLLDVEPVGVIGFCMGGMYTMKAASTGRFDRAARLLRDDPRSGRLARARSARRARHAPRCRERQNVCSRSSAPPIRTRRAADVDALEAAGATVVRYEGAEHGFVHDASRPGASSRRRGRRVAARRRLVVSRDGN